MRDKSLGDKLMYILKDKQNYTFCSLQLLVQQLRERKKKQYLLGTNKSKLNKSSQKFDPTKKKMWLWRFRY